MSILFADRIEESEADEIRALVASLKTPCDCGADNLPHEYGSACPAQPVAISEGRVSVPQKCKYGDHPATKSLIWAEGAAYVPVCDDHESEARAHLGAHEVNRVIPIEESAIIMARGGTRLAGRTYEEAKHPRGRGGKWTAKLGAMKKGDEFHWQGVRYRHEGASKYGADRVNATKLHGGQNHVLPADTLVEPAGKKPSLMRRSPGERSGAGSAPPEARPAGLLTAQKDAQDRHRRLHNEGVAKDEVAVGDLKNLSDDEIRQLADRMMKTKSLDQQPEAWRKALAKEANKRASKRRSEGADYVEPKRVRESVLDFNPALHPRGRGGEFRDVLGRLRTPELHVRGTGMTIKASRRPLGTRGDEFERGARVILSGGRRGMVLHTASTGRTQFGSQFRGREYVPPKYAVSVDGGATEYIGHNQLRYDEAGMAERHGRAEEIAAKAEKGGVAKSSFRPVQNPVTLNASVVPGEWQVAHGYGEWQNPAHRNPGEGERVRIMPTHKTHADKTGTVTRDAYAETGRSGRTLIDVQFGSNEASVPISNQDVMREDQKAWVRQKPGTNVEKMIFHYLAGKEAPPNPAPGTAKFEQFSYGMKGGSKSGYTKRPANAAERGALIRKITQALQAREREDWDEYARLLEVACTIRAVSDGLDEDDLEESGLYDMFEASHVVVDWNPTRHPRGRGGMFREVLAHLNVNGYHDLGHGVKIEKGIVGMKVHLPGGQTKSFLDSEKGVQHAVMLHSDEVRKASGSPHFIMRYSPGEHSGDSTIAARNREGGLTVLAQTRRIDLTGGSKAQALVDSGLADDLADARAQIADMGEGPVRNSPGESKAAAIDASYHAGDSLPTMMEKHGSDDETLRLIHQRTGTAISTLRRIRDEGSKRGKSGAPVWKGDRVEGLQQIVSQHQAHEIDGHLVDVQTADLLLKVHDALKPENKAKFGTVPLAKLTDLAWKSIR